MPTAPQLRRTDFRGPRRPNQMLPRAAPGSPSFEALRRLPKLHRLAHRPERRPRTVSFRQSHQTKLPSAIAHTAQRARRNEPVRERPIFDDGRRSLFTEFSSPVIVALPSRIASRGNEQPLVAAFENMCRYRAPQRCSVDLIRYTKPTRLLIADRLIFLHCRQTAVKCFAAIQTKTQFLTLDVFAISVCPKLKPRRNRGKPNAAQSRPRRIRPMRRRAGNARG